MTMDSKIIKSRSGPESIIQQEIIKYLKLKDWYTIETHGNAFQSGLPDIFACHCRYGQRWIEVKNPENYRFTAAQLRVFPKLCANGSGVWVLVAATDYEYNKLFKMYNWALYLL